MYILYLYTPTKNLQNKNGLLFLLFEIILAFYRYNFLGLSKNIEFVFLRVGQVLPYLIWLKSWSCACYNTVLPHGIKVVGFSSDVTKPHQMCESTVTHCAGVPIVTVDAMLQTEEDDDWPELEDGPIADRQCRDVVFLIIFILYLGGMVSYHSYVI